ncbi:hypothetical protein GALL_299980 [mine drainage metagenome]|uniref:DUF2934 domain-containing protein n=1 Tax=mine drainage metagenome TaxID=410659 RepID=A0A1J5QXT9_9ZZZZ
MSMDQAESIRRRAFQIWEDQGRPEGRDMDHWLQAEAELSPAPVSTGVPAASPARRKAAAKPAAAKPAMAKATPRKPAAPRKPKA